MSRARTWRPRPRSSMTARWPTSPAERPDGHDHDPRRHRSGGIRPHPAVRRPGLRPSVVRLLGGRRSRIEGGAPVVAEPVSAAPADSPRPKPTNPFLADLEAKAPVANPFATARPANPFLTPGEDDDPGPVENPFAPAPPARPKVAPDAPRKLQLLGRGLGVVGSYAKVLLEDDVAKAYAQFGPLTAYPRAQRTRDLYPSLPDAPLPAVITCIATTAGRARSRSGQGAHRRGLRRPDGTWLHGGRDLPGDRCAAGCDQRRDTAILGVGRLRDGHRRRAIPGHAPRPRLTANNGARTLTNDVPDAYLSRRPPRPRAARHGADLPRLGSRKRPCGC